MKIFLFVLCCICMKPGFSQTKLTTADKEYKLISETLTRKSIALINLDTVFLTSLIDPAFVYINSKGKALDKNTYINTISKGKLKFISQRAEITSITKVRKVYYMTAILKDEFIYDEKTVVATHNTVNIFIRRRNTFHWIFGQSTEIAK